jgi:hypothetical protein
MAAKDGYESIPDVEKGDGGVALSTKEKYANLELDDQQVILKFSE